MLEARHDLSKLPLSLCCGSNHLPCGSRNTLTMRAVNLDDNKEAYYRGLCNEHQDNHPGAE